MEQPALCASGVVGHALQREASKKQQVICCSWITRCQIEFGWNMSLICVFLGQYDCFGFFFFWGGWGG